MNADVEKAVESMRLRFTSGNGMPVERAHIRDYEWAAITQALRDQEAEIATLRSAGQKALRANIRLRGKATSAEILLAEVLGFIGDVTDDERDITARITTHLGATHAQP